MPSLATKAAVRFVQQNMPPGTKVRHIVNGKMYVVGVKFRNTDFWMMCLESSEKATLHSQIIKAQFDKVEEPHA